MEVSNENITTFMNSYTSMTKWNIILRLSGGTLGGLSHIICCLATNTELSHFSLACSILCGGSIPIFTIPFYLTSLSYYSWKLYKM